MEPFFEFTAAFSLLEPDEYIETMMLLWTFLSMQADNAKKQADLNPSDDYLTQQSLLCAKMLLAFSDLVKAGNDMTNTVLEKMRDDAIHDPSHPRREWVIEETSKLLNLDNPYTEAKKKPDGLN